MVRILVCLKQVPDTDDIKWTENNTIQREGLVSILNPSDDYALEIAKKIKNNYPAKVTVLSMGPNQAKDILNYGLARVADEAILLSDKAFSGSDTYATAKIISTAIKNLNLKPDIVLCGNSALDGETSQTPVGIAEFLGYNFVSNVKDFNRLNSLDSKILVKQELPEFSKLIEVRYPAVLSVIASGELSKISVYDYMRAQGTEIQLANLDKIAIPSSDCGIKGSPTLVKKAYRPIFLRKAVAIDKDLAFQKIGEVLR
ncbi:electron transfer flavoprotein subunit beta/FixA family protein [bacterium]|nr:electron transfer flavoprotein subunit beta/FixA family protein [bacterium]